MVYLKLFHVLFIFVWMGSLLGLTRLLGYLPKEVPEVQLRLGKILKRSYFFVDFPSMILAVALGLILLFMKDMDWKAPWLHMKLTFAFLLIVTDLICGWQIVKRSVAPFYGKGVGYKILHACSAIFLIGVLISIYILKQSAF